MPKQEFKARDKTVEKMGRDGLMRENLRSGEVVKAGRREAESLDRTVQGTEPVNLQKLRVHRADQDQKEEKCRRKHAQCSGSIQALLFADRKRNWIRAHRLIYLNRRKKGKAFRMQADRIAGFCPVLNVQRIHTVRHPKLCPAEVIPEAGLSGKNDFLNIL